jgi:hypothetical protein
MVPGQLSRCFVEHPVVRYPSDPGCIDECVLGLEHGEMQLRHQHVRSQP